MVQVIIMEPKILTFAPMPPTITGGIEEYAYSVITELREQGLNARLITSRFRGNAKSLPADDVYLYILSFILFERPVPISLLAFFKVIKAIRESDIIHIHMPYPFLESFAAFISKIFNKKIIVTYHMDAKIDTELTTAKKRILHFIIEKIYIWFSAKWPLVFCDIICTNTKAYAVNSPLLKSYLNKVYVVHQGIRKALYYHLDQRYAQRIRAEYLAQNYSYIVTFVGRLVPYKGLSYLIDAIRLLETKKVLLIIGGDGPEKGHLIELVKSYNLNNVVFVGYVNDEDLFNLFAASDLVVSPSISELESTPITLLSALAVGTPVIGTSIGGTAETIPNDGITGSIIPIKDSKLLAETIKSMLQQKNQNQNKIKTWPIPRFWSDVAKEYVHIIYNFYIAMTKSKKDI